MSELEMRGYAVLLERVKSEVQSARTRAALAVNRELVELYWRLGRLILDRQDAETYGTKVIERLAADLRVAFPEMRGLGRRNLHYMRSFAEAWPDVEVVQRLIAQLPWGHNVELLSALDAPSDRVWYADHRLHRLALLPHPDEAIRGGRAEAFGVHARGSRQAELLRQRRGRPTSHGARGSDDRAVAVPDAKRCRGEVRAVGRRNTDGGRRLHVGRPSP